MMRQLSDEESAIRSRIESLFRAVHPTGGDCALVEFTWPSKGGLTEVVAHVQFSCGRRKLDGDNGFVTEAIDLDDQINGTVSSILEVWPDAADRLLIWRILPEVTWYPRRRASKKFGFPGNPEMNVLYCRLTAIPFDAVEVRATSAEREARQ